MVARNFNHSRIRCLVVSVPSESARLAGPSRGALARDVLPWADPYVAGLIKKLQDEVRQERRQQSPVRHYRPAVVEETDKTAPGYYGHLTSLGEVLADSLDDTSEEDMLFAQ